MLRTESLAKNQLTKSFGVTQQKVCIVFCYQIAENIIEISRTTGILVDPVYNIKAIRGMLTEMKNNPGRFKGKEYFTSIQVQHFITIFLSPTEGLI